MELSWPVSKPGIAQVSLLHLLSLEGWWRARCELPSAAVEPGQRNSSVASKNIGLSVAKHLPSVEAAPTLPISPSAHLLWMFDLHDSSLELVVRVRKPPDRAAYIGFLNEAIIKMLGGRMELTTHRSWPTSHQNATTPSRPLRSSSLWSPISIAGHGCGASQRLCLFTTVFGQLS